MSNKPNPAPGGVQSVHRALDVLDCFTASGTHMPVGKVAEAAGLPAPTTHRILRTLLERGYLRQLPDRTYALGLRLVPLGVAAQRMVGASAEDILRELVEELGETANLAILAGHQAEYIAQAPSRHAMRMFTEIGRRVDLHSTGVGKALLAQLDDSSVRAVVRSRGLRQMTEHTIVTEIALLAELDRIRSQGYAVDEEEQEVGVRCIAVAVGGPTAGGMAVSVSGPTPRMTGKLIERAVPLLHAAAAQLVSDAGH
jgi:IclR family acetate operon transcriptional repressor